MGQPKHAMLGGVDAENTASIFVETVNKATPAPRLLAPIVLLILELPAKSKLT